MANFCGKCGSSLPADAAFCENCGAAVPPMPGKKTSATTKLKRPSAPKNPLLAIIISVLVAFAVIFVLIYFLVIKDADEPKSKRRRDNSSIQSSSNEEKRYDSNEYDFGYVFDNMCQCFEGDFSNLKDLAPQEYWDYLEDDYYEILDNVEVFYDDYLYEELDDVEITDASYLINRCTTLDDEELEDVINDMYDYSINESDITSAVEITGEFSLDYDYEYGDYVDFTLTLVEIDGEWYPMYEFAGEEWSLDFCVWKLQIAVNRWF